MARGKRMCPNEDCGDFGQPTGLLGGCNCGTQLVPYRSFDEQMRDALWEFASPSHKRLVSYMMLAQFQREQEEHM